MLVELPAARSSRLRPAACVLGLVAAVLATYLNSLSGPFVFDDPLSITENPTIRSLSWTAFVPPAGSGLTVEGRPVLNYSLALNYAWSGTGVWTYHVVNLAIHALAALTLFGLVRRTLARYDAGSQLALHSTDLAFVVALLWALHPLQTESVTYIVQRTESLMGLLYLFTLYCVVRGCERTDGRGWFVAAVASCFLGMATKEVMVSAPLIVWLYDRAFIAGTFRDAWRQRARLYTGLASSWVLLVFLTFGAGNRGGTIGAQAGVTWWQYALCQARAITHYLSLSLWPEPLVFDYGSDFVTPLEAAPYVALTLGWVALTVVALRRRPALGFLGAWFFAILAPTTSILGGTRQMLAEHRMYLSLAAVVVLAVLGAGAWLGRRSWWLWPALALALGGASAHRNLDYRSDCAIYGDTVAKRPGNALARNNYGTALLTAGRLTEAAEQFTAALRLWPDYPQAHNNLAGVFYRLGRADECIRHATLALERQPNYPEAHNNLGTAWLHLGQTSTAIAHYHAALRLRPDATDVRKNLAGALLQAGQTGEAIAQFEATLRTNPADRDAHYGLGLALQQDGQLAAAMGHYEAALRAQPDYPEAHNNLGVTLMKSQRPGEAIAHYEAALRLRPAYLEARTNLVLALLQANRVPDAIRQLELVLRANPEHLDARLQLARTLCAAGQPAAAIVHYEAAARQRPDDPDIHNNLGSVLFQGSERTAEAIAHFETALRLKPSHAEAHSNLGVALVYQGKNAEAIAHFEAALRLDPTSVEARKNLDRLRAHP